MLGIIVQGTIVHVRPNLHVTSSLFDQLVWCYGYIAVDRLVWTHLLERNEDVSSQNRHLSTKSVTKAPSFKNSRIFKLKFVFLILILKSISISYRGVMKKIFLFSCLFVILDVFNFSHSLSLAFYILHRQIKLYYFSSLSLSCFVSYF